MSSRGLAFLEGWMANNVSQQVRQSTDGDVASFSIELAERAVADARKAGLDLDDLELEHGTPETIIRESLETGTTDS
jgi:nucleotide-binding universal stress UspA family protein